MQQAIIQCSVRGGGRVRSRGQQANRPTGRRWDKSPHCRDIPTPSTMSLSKGRGSAAAAGAGCLQLQSVWPANLPLPPSQLLPHPPSSSLSVCLWASPYRKVASLCHMRPPDAALSATQHSTASRSRSQSKNSNSNRLHLWCMSVLHHQQRQQQQICIVSRNPGNAFHWLEMVDESNWLPIYILLFYFICCKLCINRKLKCGTYSPSPWGSTQPTKGELPHIVRPKEIVEDHKIDELECTLSKRIQCMS